MRTLGLSPKIIGPLAAAFAAFAQAKIHDAATATLVVALIGAVGLYFAPPGDVAAAVDPVYDDDADSLEDPDDLLEAADGDPEGIVRPEAGTVPTPPSDEGKA